MLPLPGACRIERGADREMPMDRLFTIIATKSATIMGQPGAFILSTVLIIIWAISGPFLHYSDTWQLIVNTATTVLTFLAVFLIQNSQNRDGAAMQAKLDEIIRALDNAREEFVGIEHLSDSEICRIRDALEREIAERPQEPRKQATAGGTVNRLLKRY
jgi:low affinity Fe/Cu permease